METTHGDIGLIRTLAEEARASSAEMLHALLGRLRVKIQLPECLRAVGYSKAGARRSDASSYVFELSRGIHRAVRGGAGRFESVRLSEKLTDTHRVALFDLVMQYRAIFSGDTEGRRVARGARSCTVGRRTGFQSTLN